MYVFKVIWVKQWAYPRDWNCNWHSVDDTSAFVFKNKKRDWYRVLLRYKVKRALIDLVKSENVDLSDLDKIEGVRTPKLSESSYKIVAIDTIEKQL